MGYAGMLLCCFIGTVQESAPVRLSVVLHNQAELTGNDLGDAKRIIDGIFRHAGIEIGWHDRSPEPREQPPFLVSVLIRRRDAKWAPNQRPVMGLALDSDRRRGVTMIFYEAIAGVARHYNQAVVDLLAITIAHEIGHLLLPHPAHATSGVMRAEWEGDDLRHAVHEQLRFTAAQAERIRVKLSGTEETKRVE